MKNKIKIIIVAGARPNFIKIWPIFEHIKNNPLLKKKIELILVHTGQHYDYEMSELFFKELSIPAPKYNLGVKRKSHAQQTAEIMAKSESIMEKEKPDLVIVVGDVNSTLAGAIVAAKLEIPVCHIEAGVRSYDMNMPEEINRVLTDRISNFLFCPTRKAVSNLKKEGINSEVYNSGDITYDAFLKILKIRKKPEILSKIKVNPKKYILFTLHRQSNTDNLDNLKKILSAVNKSKIEVVFPIHPRTKNRLRKINFKKAKNLKIIDPVGFLDMVILEKNALKIITDSGGIQKEAYWLKIPCITLRENTEWPETLKGGWNTLAGFDEWKIARLINGLILPKKQKNYFGNGKAAEKIIKIIIKNLNG